MLGLTAWSPRVGSRVGEASRPRPCERRPLRRPTASGSYNLQQNNGEFPSRWLSLDSRRNLSCTPNIGQCIAPEALGCLNSAAPAKEASTKSARGSRPWWKYISLALLALVCRIGEASHPGPPTADLYCSLDDPDGGLPLGVEFSDHERPAALVSDDDSSCDGGGPHKAPVEASIDADPLTNYPRK